MKRKNATRSALFTSIIALLMCVSMLVGTTFAWFTDSATSANNKIVAGNLDVDLYMWTAADTSTEITNETDPIFGEGSIAQNVNDSTLWEPGKTQVAYLSIKNNGTLDLKYKVAIDVDNVAKDLYEVMEYAITPDAKFGEVTSWNGGNTVATGLNDTDANDVVLKKGEEHFFALSVHMQEEAGNQYMDGQVNFDIKVLAGQLASELDSFGADYDALASYPGSGFAELGAGDTAVTVEIKNESDTKVGSALVPKEAVAEGNSKVTVTIDDSSYEANITVAAGSETVAFDVEVEGLKENNDVPVKIQLRIPAGLDPSTVVLYHYDTEIDSSYNPNTGYVTFESATFSPFTIVYDAESKYVPPVINPDDSEIKIEDKASVVKSPEYEGVELPWGSYGQWSPNPDLEAELEAAYTFACKESLEEAKENPYANWYCDFYVKLDRDLGENQIFLGGNYGTFGWVGFHNGDLTLEANTEIGLLESVTTNPWTYLDVVQNVGTFICGVGDVDDALADATFTVMLRLTDPEDKDNFINVATITHTFTKEVNSGEELQDAINNGNSNIELGGDIDLSQGIVIPGV